MPRVPAAMNAMVLEGPGRPLRLNQVAIPRPSAEQVLMRVRVCGVCRTDLHILDGELREPKLPLIPGHEIVGTVVEGGTAADRFRPGDRIGVPRLGRWCL